MKTPEPGTRVLVAGLWHETNTFSPLPTTLADFEAFCHVSGEAMLAHHHGTNTEIGGFLDAAPGLGLVLVPALYAAAVPSGTVSARAFDALAEALCRRARAASRLDGVLLALHGAMVVEGCADAEAVLVRRLRTVVGPGVPLVATLDIHANVSVNLFDAADALIGYDTYPHTDMAERGREAAAMLSRIVEDRRCPARALVKLPLLTVPQVQATGEEPMRGVISALHEEERGALASGTVTVGFPYADVGHLGVAALGYGDDERAVAEAVERVAAGIWAERDAFVPSLIDAPAAVERALRAARGPVVLVDVADNVGGGSPGDGTMILESLLRAHAPSATVVIWDPPAAAGAVALGAGARFSAEVGGRSDPGAGAPVALDGRIVFAAPVTYRREASYMTGLPVDLGRVAVIEHGGVRVVLTERRAMPFDTGHLRAVGIDPEGERILVAKSAIAWRAAFGAFAADFIDVDTPGACAANLARLDYREGGDRLFPVLGDGRAGGATPPRRRVRAPRMLR